MFAMIASYSFSSWNNGAHQYASSLLSLQLCVVFTINLDLWVKQKVNWLETVEHPL